MKAQYDAFFNSHMRGKDVRGPPNFFSLPFRAGNTSRHSSSPGHVCVSCTVFPPQVLIGVHKRETDKVLECAAVRTRTADSGRPLLQWVAAGSQPPQLSRFRDLALPPVLSSLPRGSLPRMITTRSSTRSSSITTGRRCAVGAE